MTNEKTDVAGLEVVPRLPDRLGPEYGEELPEGLVGSRIVRFGTISEELAHAIEPPLEGGGLFIDYAPEGESLVRRVVLSLNEAGMWMVYQGTLPGPVLPVPSQV